MADLGLGSDGLSSSQMSTTAQVHQSYMDTAMKLKKFAKPKLIFGLIASLVGLGIFSAQWYIASQHVDEGTRTLFTVLNVVILLAFLWFFVANVITAAWREESHHGTSHELARQAGPAMVHSAAIAAAAGGGSDISGNDALPL